MAGRRTKRNAEPVADLVGSIVDPILKKRAGISIDMIQSWDEIVGEKLAGVCRPQRLAWPRRRNEDDPFEPATLLIAAEGPAALLIQHQSGELIARVNQFLGFHAVNRIKFVQKPVAVHEPHGRTRPKPLSDGQANQVRRRVSGIEDDRLRASLERLGRAILSESSFENEDASMEEGRYKR